MRTGVWFGLSTLLPCACAEPRAPLEPVPSPPGVAESARAVPTTSVSAAPTVTALEPATPTAKRERVVGITFGEDHACALRSGGGVTCWGSNRDNRTGVGSGISEVVAPTSVRGVADAVSVVAAYDHSCAALRGGRLACWGAAQHLVGADPDPADGPVISKTEEHVVELASTGSELLARLDDGQVRMWESLTSRMYFLGPGMKPPKSWCDGCIVPNLKNVILVASGFNTHCAVHADHTLSCFGGNEYGQLGRGKAEPVAEGTLPPRTPSKVTALSHVSEVSVSSHVCARLDDGHVACWGKNDHGQVGDGSTATRMRPVTLSGLDRVTHVAVGRDTSCAIRDDGSVWCWGLNDEGQLGDGTSSDRHVPTPVGGVTGAVKLALGPAGACAIRSDGEIWCWGFWDLRRKTAKEREEKSREPVRVPW
ncbi:MAG: hypothetical protein U0263_26095 [Polyangiaceae bacterium]